MNSENIINKDKVELNQIKLKDMFENIKSKYILNKVFNHIKRKQLLDIFKYNKNIQKRININIDDYKEYSEKFSLIEIEVKPVNNKYGEFIKINEKDKIYYHIYFNNNDKEIKRNCINKDEQIKIIKIIIDYQITSFKDLFYKCECIEYIYFKKFHRNNINNMSCMFLGCSSLKELNINNLKTNNVTNMAEMFRRCISLKELNLNNFNTINVLAMSYMFCGCSSLKELNLNNFNTNNVTNMTGMFYGCSSLKEMNLINLTLII